MAIIKFPSSESTETKSSRGLTRVVRTCLALPAGLLLLVFLPLLFISFILCSGALGLIGRLTGTPPLALSFESGPSETTVE